MNDHDKLRADLEWIVRNLDNPDKAAKHSHRGIAAIKYVAEAALAALGGKGEACQYQHRVVVNGPSATTSSGIGCLATGGRCVPGSCSDCPTQPEAQGEAVAWHILHEDGGSHVMLAESVDEKFRDALAANGRNLRPLIYGDTAAPKVAEGVEAVELTLCCGREECGGECGNEWRGTHWVRKAAPKPGEGVPSLKWLNEVHDRWIADDETSLGFLEYLHHALTAAQQQESTK